MTTLRIGSDRLRIVPLESPAPDPRNAASPAEFVAQLRRLKAWSDLTYRRLEKEALRRGHVLPHSTIATALKRDSLPRTELVAALVSACGGDEETVALWVTVRQRLSTGDEPSAGRPEEPRAETVLAPVAPVPPSGRDGRHGRIRRTASLVAVLAAGLVLVGAAQPVSPRPRGHPTAAAPALPAPAAWWHFEEGGGAIAYDASHHGADATLGGGATRVAVPGGHALMLGDGGHAGTLRPVVRSDLAFTLTAWVRLDDTDDWGTVISLHHDSPAPDVVLLDYDAEHRDWAFMMPDRRKGWAMGDETVFGGVRPVRGRWTHLAAVHDPAGRRVCLYVDGTLEACRTRASLTRANGPLDIGQALRDGDPVDGWHGAVDDVRVFSHALTRAQLAEVVAHRT
jgi:hypothetical protein